MSIKNRSRNSPLPLGEGQGVRAESAENRPHPNPLPKGEGTIRGIALTFLLLISLAFAAVTWHGTAWADEETEEETRDSLAEKAKDDGSASKARRDALETDGAKNFEMASWYHPETDRSEKEQAKQSQRVKAAYRKLQDLDADKTDERIETALEILRNYSLPRFQWERQMEWAARSRMAKDRGRAAPPRPAEPDNVPWVSAMRTLIEIGKPAVPRLIDELDSTNRYHELQALGFTLRAIGDSRAIPALIRAIPRTLQLDPRGYPVQIRIDTDRDLLNFMRKYDLVNHFGKGTRAADDNIPENRIFGFDPGAEIKNALCSLTQQDLAWLEIKRVALRGSLKQHDLQRAVVLKNMRAWADWWTFHWQKHVSNKGEAQLALIEKALDQYAQELPEPQDEEVTEIPCGRNAVVSGNSVLFRRADVMFPVKAFNESPLAFADIYSRFGSLPQATQERLLNEELPKLLKMIPCMIDLDTCRTVEPPKEFLNSLPQEDRFRPSEPPTELLAWAEKQGCHLIGYRVRQAGNERGFIALKPLNVKLWLIADDRVENLNATQETFDKGRYEHLDKEIRESKRIKLSSPWEAPIGHYDAKTSKFDDTMIPSFYFITKAGTCGAMQLRRSDPNIASSEGLEVRYIYKKPAKK
jgi:hypothetical protein